MTGLAEVADAATRAGICVLPVASDGSKRPAIPWAKYQDRKPTPSEIDAWFGLDSSYSGIGAVCGPISGGLEMLEFEGRAVEEGLLEAFDDLADAAGMWDVVKAITDGYTERTPSGGIHLLYRCDAGDGNLKLARRPATEIELAENPDDRIKVLIETRGKGGFTILAPSNGTTHPTGGAWVLSAGALDQIVTITPEQRRAVHQLARTFDQMPHPVTSDSVSQVSVRKPDTSDGDRPGDLYNARTTWAEILEPRGWVRVYERGETTYWRRPGKKDGISATTNALGTDRLKVFSSSTPFDDATTYDRFGAYAVLEHRSDVKAAGRALYADGYHEQKPYDQHWPVYDAATAPNGPVEPHEVTVLRGQLITGEGITRIPPAAPLIERILDLDSLVGTIGKPGSGKTFGVLDMACCVAAGIDWHGYATTPGPVIYVAAEGLAGLGQRVNAWLTRYDHPDLSNVRWLPRAVNLLEDKWVTALVALAVEIRPVLVVIDTVARSMIGGDENTSKDMGRLIEASDTVRRASGSCVNLVHHLGKNAENGARGSNSFEAGVDTLWEVARESQYLTLNCQRQKNHALPDKPLSFVLANVAGSCVVDTDTRRPADTMHESIRTTLTSLAEVETAGGTSPSVWLKSSGIQERTFYRHVKKLIEFELIANVNTDKQPKYRITDEGRSTLTTDKVTND